MIGQIICTATYFILNGGKNTAIKIFVQRYKHEIKKILQIILKGRAGVMITKYDMGNCLHCICLHTHVLMRFI